jgi:hypothetical protein
MSMPDPSIPRAEIVPSVDVAMSRLDENLPQTEIILVAASEDSAMAAPDESTFSSMSETALDDPSLFVLSDFFPMI